MTTRGMLVLEQLRTAEAVAIVKGMTTGDARVEPTKVANPVLSRYWSFVHRVLGVA